MLCFVFDCYENIAESVSQTRATVAFARNSNRTGAGSNSSYKNDNDGPRGIVPPSPSVCFVLSFIVIKTLLKLFHRHEQLSLSPGTATELGAVTMAAAKTTTTGPGALHSWARWYVVFSI